MHRAATLRLTRWPLAVPAALAALAAAGASAAVDDVAVTVDKRGPTVVVDVNVEVGAPLADTWAALTDYERMPAFLPHIKQSKVMRREGNQLEVAQKSENKVAFMRFELATVRRVELAPMQEIRTQLVSGDFKSYATTTRLVEKGEHTLVVYHGEYVPTTAPPPIVGVGIIENHTRKHFQLIAAEARRRSTEAAPQK